MLMAEPDPGIGGLMMRAFRAVDVLSERSLPARPKKGGFKQSLTGFREEGRPRRIVGRGCRMGASPGHLRQNIHPALSPLTHASFTAPGGESCGIMNFTGKRRGSAHFESAPDSRLPHGFSNRRDSSHADPFFPRPPSPPHLKRDFQAWMLGSTQNFRAPSRETRVIQSEGLRKQSTSGGFFASAGRNGNLSSSPGNPK